jgi:predicted ATPase
MLSDLFVRDFRCFAEAKVELHPDATLLVGRNAQGKTSLIEAACVLLRLQSPRTTNRSELVRFGASTCLVEASWHGKRLRYAQSATTRRLAWDGTTCGKVGDYLAASGVVVWMDHRDMSLLRGGAEHRRQPRRTAPRRGDRADSRRYRPRHRRTDQGRRATRQAASFYRGRAQAGGLLKPIPVVRNPNRLTAVNRLRPIYAAFRDA